MQPFPPPFPWREAMRVGFGVLRLTPAAFWAMTPRELAAAVAALSPGGRPLDRDGFAALMRRYPDDRQHP